MPCRYVAITPGSSSIQKENGAFITTDHRRGDIIKGQWTAQGRNIADFHKIWLTVMGPGISAKGEITTFLQLYQNQFAQTIADMPGFQFTASHPIGTVFDSLLK